MTYLFELGPMALVLKLHIQGKAAILGISKVVAIKDKTN